MPAEKSKLLEEGQKELKYLRRLKQEILGKMPKKKNIFTKALILLLEEQLNKLEDKIREAEEKLREATNASDMVNPEIFDEVKGILEDLAEGKTDEAIETVKEIAQEEIDHIIDEKITDETIAETVKDVIDRTMDGDIDGVVDVVKDGAQDKAEEIIDEKIKDETIAETVKDVIDRTMDGDVDGVVDAIKDGAKDKAEEVIDKHVKDEKIAEILKDVVDGAIDGEWDSLLDIVKDGVVDIAAGKLEDFINKLIELFEDEIKIKLELDMKAAAKLLVPKTLQTAKKKAVGYWTAELAKQLSIRLVKEIAELIKEEIKRLTSEGGIKELVQIAKEALMETLKGGLAGRKIKDLLKDLVQNVANNKKFKRIIKNFKNKVVSRFYHIVKEIIETVVGGAIDAYLRVHSPWAGTLLSVDKSVKIGPLWGCVNLELGVDIALQATLRAKRKKLKAIGKASLEAKLMATIGISIGFDIPLVGDISITGGIQVGPKINASASLHLEPKNAIIQASVYPATVDVKAAADLFLKTPIPNRILKYVPVYLTSTTVAAQTITYPLGAVSLLVVTTPRYTFKFNTKTKKYTYVKAAGSYNIDASPKVKASLKEIKEAIEEAAQYVVDLVNPTTWDLNPFDEDGWAGGWF